MTLFKMAQKMQTVDEKISKKVTLETTEHSRLRIVFSFVERKNGENGKTKYSAFYVAL